MFDPCLTDHRIPPRQSSQLFSSQQLLRACCDQKMLAYKLEQCQHISAFVVPEVFDQPVTSTVPRSGPARLASHGALPTTWPTATPRYVRWRLLAAACSFTQKITKTAAELHTMQTCTAVTGAESTGTRATATSPLPYRPTAHLLTCHSSHTDKHLGTCMPSTLQQLFTKVEDVVSPAAVVTR